MKSLTIRYQTSELIPAPFAHAIEIILDLNHELNYQFELTYIDRDQLTEDEILEEGFSTNDDLVLKGTFKEPWMNALEILLIETKKTHPVELKEDQEFWEITAEKDIFFPKNPKPWKIFIDQFQQACLEQNFIEKPLEISICRKDNEVETSFLINGCFENRSLEVITNGILTKQIEWNKLNPFLMNLYSGEFDFEKASVSIPKKTGLFINLGDEIWYEVGKSLLIQPSKITAWIDAL